ncbi:MAG: TolC family protein [Planctomycetota bacterium]|jgi:outer membrane protein TolC|nr:TolC family protein [Planctomycetota bacterium]
MTMKKLFFLAAAFAVTAAAGCIPEGEESIRQEIEYVRGRAYEEWRDARERGDSREAKAEGPLTLDDAIKLALQYSKPMQRQVYEREVARGERMSAYRVILPNATLSAGYSRSEKQYGVSEVDSARARLRVTQPIWQGAYIPASLRSAQLGVALADEGIREMVQTLIADVANTYYDVLLSQHMVETYKEALASAEAQLRMVTEKRKQETATDYDVLRAQVDVATYRASMISEQNNIDSSRVSLLKLMGVSQDSAITFADKLEFLPMRPVFERAVEIASSHRADLRQAEISARMEQEAIRIAQSNFFPAISGTFDQAFDRRDQGRGAGLERNPWTAGLSASLDFGVDNWGDLRAERARARQAQIDLLNTQEQTLMEIRQEMNNLTNREEIVNSLVVNQEAAREALRLVLVGYQAGVKTEVDVTDARKALTEVQGQYYTALANHTKSRLNLQVAMGVLGPSAVTDGTQMRPNVPIANIEEFAAADYTPPTPLVMPAPELRSGEVSSRPRPAAREPRESRRPQRNAQTPATPDREK